MAISAKLVKELRDKTGAGMLDCKKALEAVEGDLEKAFDWLRENGIAKAAKKADRIAAEGLTTVAIDGNNAAIVEVNSETDFVAKNQEFKDLVNNIAAAIVKALPADMDAANAIEIDGKPISQVVAETTAKIGEKLSFRRFEIVTKADDEEFGSYSHNGGTITSLVAIAKTTADKAKDVAMHVAAQAPAYISRDYVPAEVVERETNVAKNEMANDPKMANKPEKVLENILKGKVSKVLADICLVDQEFIKDPSLKVGAYLGNGTIKTMIRYAVGEGMQKREENFAEEVAAQMAK